jgi:2-haloacid dehalogenase
MKLTDFKALTFDCYGTLIDWESGMLAALSPLAKRAGGKLAREAILEAHARHEAAQQRVTPHMRYRDLLAVVHKRLAEEWGVPASWDEARAYGSSIKDWPAFPDSAEALAYLKTHYRLAVLSNVDNESFAFSNAKLGVVFDAIYTAEDIGSYKPAVRNFDYMLEKLATLGLAKRDILHTAQSLFHDHEPAGAIGLANCWIDRRAGKAGFGAVVPAAGETKVDFQFPSLGAFAEAHRRERVG